MARASALALLVGLVLAIVPSAQAPLTPQMGLRLDPLYSLQWQGGTIYAEGEARARLATSVKEIYDIWPGTAPGSFSISSTDGIGLLMGRNVVPGGFFIERSALVRSSRPDVLWASVVDTGSAGHTKFVAWSPPNEFRLVFETPDAVTDFDVDTGGRIVYLTGQGAVRYVGHNDGSTAVIDIPLPAQLKTLPRRVFVTADSSEIAVYFDGSLARLNVPDKTWTVEPFEPRRDALVRHVTTRRMRIEPKFQ